jgi:hypothetical protein
MAGPLTVTLEMRRSWHKLKLLMLLLSLKTRSMHCCCLAN